MAKMTILILLALLVFAVLVLAGVTSRISLARKSREELTADLKLINLPAFQNLVRPEEDAFLRASLPARYYRAAKRARIRAVQRYLLWIAGDCLLLKLLARPSANAQPGDADWPESLLAMSSRIRSTALFLFSALWVQWVFPELDLVPTSLVDRYAEFASRIRAHLPSRRLAAGSDARP